MWTGGHRIGGSAVGNGGNGNLGVVYGVRNDFGNRFDTPLPPET